MLSEKNDFKSLKTFSITNSVLKINFPSILLFLFTMTANKDMSELNGNTE